MDKQSDWHKMVLRTIDFLKAYKSKKGSTHPRKWLQHAVTQCDAVLALTEMPEYQSRPWEITTDQFDHGDWEPDYVIIRPEWAPVSDGMSSPSVEFMTPCLYLLDSFEYNGWMAGCGIDGRELTAEKVRGVVTLIKMEAEERLAK